VSGCAFDLGALFAELERRAVEAGKMTPNPETPASPLKDFPGAVTPEDLRLPYREDQD
jgi:hypothetical protein